VTQLNIPMGRNKESIQGGSHASRGVTYRRLRAAGRETGSKQNDEKRPPGAQKIVPAQPSGCWDITFEFC
jgi:hypothetical protein